MSFWGDDHIPCFRSVSMFLLVTSPPVICKVPLMRQWLQGASWASFRFQRYSFVSWPSYLIYRLVMLQVQRSTCLHFGRRDRYFYWMSRYRGLWEERLAGRIWAMLGGLSSCRPRIHAGAVLGSIDRHWHSFVYIGNAVVVYSEREQTLAGLFGAAFSDWCVVVTQRCLENSAGQAKGWPPISNFSLPAVRPNL